VVKAINRLNITSKIFKTGSFEFLIEEIYDVRGIAIFMASSNLKISAILTTH
jgi:hypothetical protein